MRYSEYPSYKDSGVEWLGEIPSGWEVKKLKYLASIQTGTTPSTSNDKYFSDTYGTPWIKPDELHSFTKIEESKRYLTSEGVKVARLIKAKSVLVCGIGTIGKLGVAGVDLTTNQQINSVTFCDSVLKPSFGKFLVSSSEKEMDRLSNGNVVKILNTESQRNILYPYPPLQEQQIIANYLDKATAKIDTLIDKQTKLIELLKEKRQAVISTAVTRGLDSSVAMKDSGVEWLGEIPEHWAVHRIGNLFTEAVEYGKTDLPILRVSIHDGVSDREYSSEEMDRKVARSEDRSKYKCVEPDDLVYNMMRAWQGGFGAVKVNGLVSPAYVVARPMKAMSTSYIELLLRTVPATEELRRYSRGITDFRLRLYWDEFKNIKIVLPPKEEINEILTYITDQSNKIDSLVKKADRAIVLLKERRIALISAAVTGKIDVRNK